MTDQDATGIYRSCPECHAPLADPFPDTWDIELVKEGEPDGPVRSWLIPHTADCAAPHADPHPGIAVRVRGNYVSHINITSPPVPADPYGVRFTDHIHRAINPEPSAPDRPGRTTWTPDDGDPVSDLRSNIDAVREAILNRPYTADIYHLTQRGYEGLRAYFAQRRDDRRTRENIFNGILYTAPISVEPPAAPEPSHTVRWTAVGHTAGFDVVGDDTMPNGTAWIGDPTAPDRGVVITGIYGGPPDDSEWACTACGYHNTGGICTHCGQVHE